MLLGAPAPALAQFADLQVPSRVLVGEAFSLDIFLMCPPPGEAPPPRVCSGVLAFFEVSEKSASFPQELVLVHANEQIRIGPFAFHKRGVQTIVLNTEEFGWIGMVEFLVESRRRK